MMIHFLLIWFSLSFSLFGMGTNSEFKEITKTTYKDIELHVMNNPDLILWVNLDFGRSSDMNQEEIWVTPKPIEYSTINHVDTWVDLDLGNDDGIIDNKTKLDCLAFTEKYRQKEKPNLKIEDSSNLGKDSSEKNNNILKERIYFFGDHTFLSSKLSCT